MQNEREMHSRPQPSRAAPSLESSFPQRIVIAGDRSIVRGRERIVIGTVDARWRAFSISLLLFAFCFVFFFFGASPRAKRERESHAKATERKEKNGQPFPCPLDTSCARLFPVLIARVEALEPVVRSRREGADGKGPGRAYLGVEPSNSPLSPSSSSLFFFSLGGERPKKKKKRATALGFSQPQTRKSFGCSPPLNLTAPSLSLPTGCVRRRQRRRPGGVQGHAPLPLREGAADPGPV